MDIIFIFGAKYLYIVSLLIGLIWYIKIPSVQKKQIAIFGFFSLVLTFILSRVASYFFYNPRPFVSENITPLIQHIRDNGFPSDHTLLVSAIATIVTFYNKKVGILLWIITLIVGISRVYVGVHHVLDIIGSIGIALLSASIVYVIQKRRLNATIASINK